MMVCPAFYQHWTSNQSSWPNIVEIDQRMNIKYKTLLLKLVKFIITIIAMFLFSQKIQILTICPHDAVKIYLYIVLLVS